MVLQSASEAEKDPEHGDSGGGRGIAIHPGGCSGSSGSGIISICCCCCSTSALSDEYIVARDYGR